MNIACYKWTKIKKNRRQPVIDFYGKYKRYKIEGLVQVVVYYLQTAEKKKEYYCLLTKKSRCCRSCFSVQISHYPLFLEESFVAKLFSNKHSGHFTLSSRLLFLVKHCTQSNLTFCWFLFLFFVCASQSIWHRKSQQEEKQVEAEKYN